MLAPVFQKNARKPDPHIINKGHFLWDSWRYLMPLRGDGTPTDIINNYALSSVSGTGMAWGVDADGQARTYNGNGFDYTTSINCLADETNATWVVAFALTATTEGAVISERKQSNNQPWFAIVANCDNTGANTAGDMSATMRNDAGTQYYATAASVNVNNGELQIWFAVKAGTSFKLYDRFGVQQGSATLSGTFTGFNQTIIGGTQGGGGAFWLMNGSVYLAGGIAKALESSEMEELGQNIWDIFYAPQYIYSVGAAPAPSSNTHAINISTLGVG